VGEDERGEEDGGHTDEMDDDVDRVVVVLAVKQELVFKVEDRVRFGCGRWGMLTLLDGASGFFCCPGHA